MTEAMRPMQLVIEYPDEPVMPHEPERIAAVCKQLTGLAMEFAGVERVPRYTPEKRENDSEHSFMLALVAAELARQFRPDLDPGRVALYAIVHDLIELVTSDEATFNLTEAECNRKEANERQELPDFLVTLPPLTRRLVADYEAQADETAVFVRLVDKLLPVAVDTLGAGRKVMAEDYDVFTDAELAASEAHLSSRLRRKFADANLVPLHLARDVMAAEFAVVFEAETVLPASA